MPILGRGPTKLGAGKPQKIRPQKIDDSKQIVARFSPMDTLGFAEGSAHKLTHKGKRVGIVYFNKKEVGKGSDRHTIFTASVWGRHLDRDDIFDPDRLISRLEDKNAMDLLQKVRSWLTQRYGLHSVFVFEKHSKAWDLINRPRLF